MNCAQFDLEVVDFAARRRHPGSAARGHLADCANCQETLFAERRLQSGLSDLRVELAASRPPATVAQNLGLHLARRRAKIVSPRSALLRFGVAAAITAVVVIPLLVIDNATVRVADGPTIATTQSAPLTQPRVATPFYRVYVAAGMDVRRAPGMVRVNVPRATLAVFGLPFNPRRADPVAADFLVDNTGVVTAVRFLQ